MIVRPLLALAFAAATLLVGCGGGASADDLLAHLPSDAEVLATVDVSAAREALELPEDADPLDRGGGSGDQRLLFAVAYALPHLERPVDLPIMAALDHSLLRAVATGGRPPQDQVTVVATEQSVEEVLEGLEERGYRREGRILVSVEPPVKVVYGAAAEADDLLLLAGSREALEDVLESDAGGGGPARKLLDELEGPVRVASARDGPRGSCLRGLGGTDRLSAGKGELMLRVEGGADPRRSRFDANEQRLPFTRAVRFGTAKAEGELLRVPFSYDASKPGVSPLALVTGDLLAGALYGCERGEADPAAPRSDPAGG